MPSPPTQASDESSSEASRGPFVTWLVGVRRVFYWVGGFVVFVTTIVIGSTLAAGVVVRYLLDSSLAWSNELPVILFPWLIMGGVVMAAATHQHLGVDFFLRRLSDTIARFIAVAVQLLIVALMGSLIHQSFTILGYMQYQHTPVLGWPASWSFYSMPVGAAGVLVLTLVDLVGLISGREPVIAELGS